MILMLYDTDIIGIIATILMLYGTDINGFIAMILMLYATDIIAGNYHYEILYSRHQWRYLWSRANQMPAVLITP